MEVQATVVDPSVFDKVKVGDRVGIIGTGPHGLGADAEGTSARPGADGFCSKPGALSESFLTGRITANMRSSGTGLRHRPDAFQMAESEGSGRTRSASSRTRFMRLRASS